MDHLYQKDHSQKRLLNLKISSNNNNLNKFQYKNHLIFHRIRIKLKIILNNKIKSRIRLCLLIHIIPLIRVNRFLLIICLPQIFKKIVRNTIPYKFKCLLFSIINHKENNYISLKQMKNCFIFMILLKWGIHFKLSSLK